MYTRENLHKFRCPSSTQTAQMWADDNKVVGTFADYRVICSHLGIVCHKTQSGKVALTQAITAARRQAGVNSVAVAEPSNSANSNTHMYTHTPPPVSSGAAPATTDSAVTAANLMQQAISLLGVAGQPQNTLSAEQVAQVCELIQTHAPKPTAHEIVVRNEKTGTTHSVGVAHEIFQEVLEWVEDKVNVYIYGPAGSGKSHIGFQVAEALGIPFGAMSFSNQSLESKLFGQINPLTGEYMPTEFYRIYSGGGVFMLDEADNASANLLNALNMALANDSASFPTGMIKKHPDFICIATANTFGNGATEEYVGRNPLDGAGKNRYISMFAGYDKNLEAARFSKQACELVWQERERLSGKKGWVLSMRDIDRCEKLFRRGYTAEVVYKRAIEANLPQNLRK
jgi:MoxR-like ATPase